MSIWSNIAEIFNSSIDFSFNTNGSSYDSHYNNTESTWHTDDINSANNYSRGYSTMQDNYSTTDSFGFGQTAQDYHNHISPISDFNGFDGFNTFL